MRHGIGYVPEGRHVFPGLTVEKNLLLGAYVRKWKGDDAATPCGEVFELFPVLGEMRHRLAGALSGGQQQMLAVGRALMSNPRLILLDEPSMGLSPKLIEDILAVLQRLRAAGHALLLVEQNAKLTFEATKTCLVMENGEVAMTGTSAELQPRSPGPADLPRALSGPWSRRDGPPPPAVPYRQNGSAPAADRMPPTISFWKYTAPSDVDVPVNAVPSWPRVVTHDRPPS